MDYINEVNPEFEEINKKWYISNDEFMEIIKDTFFTRYTYYYTTIDDCVFVLCTMIYECEYGTSVNVVPELVDNICYKLISKIDIETLRDLFINKLREKKIDKTIKNINERIN